LAVSVPRFIGPEVHASGMEEDHDTGRREDVKLRFPFVDGNATRCTRVRFAAGPGPNAPRLVSLKNASVNESDQVSRTVASSGSGSPPPQIGGRACSFICLLHRRTPRNSRGPAGVRWNKPDAIGMDASRPEGRREQGSTTPNGVFNIAQLPSAAPRTRSEEGRRGWLRAERSACSAARL
jgi:hypothetical protein